jgi:hypothetical protein
LLIFEEENSVFSHHKIWGSEVAVFEEKSVRAVNKLLDIKALVRVGVEDWYRILNYLWMVGVVLC